MRTESRGQAIDELLPDPVGERQEPVLGELAREERWLAAEQLRRQAQQLSTQLDKRLADAERRQAWLQAQEAELENGRRAGRLWLREAHADLDKRAERLRALEKSLDERASNLAAAEAYQASLRQENERRQRELDQRVPSAAPVGIDDAPRAPDEARLLAEGWAALQIAQRRLAERRRRFSEKAKAVRARIRGREQESKTELKRRVAKVRQASDELATRRAELERLRYELLAKQRELLELRVTVEHALAELTSQVPPDTLAATLAATRAKIAEQYQQARDELARQEALLAELRRQITAGHARLIQRRREIINLADQRNLLAAAQAERRAGAHKNSAS